MRELCTTPQLRINNVPDSSDNVQHICGISKII